MKKYHGPYELQTDFVLAQTSEEAWDRIKEQVSESVYARYVDIPEETQVKGTLYDLILVATKQRRDVYAAIPETRNGQPGYYFVGIHP